MNTPPPKKSSACDGYALELSTAPEDRVYKHGVATKSCLNEVGVIRKGNTVREPCEGLEGCTAELGAARKGRSLEPGGTRKSDTTEFGVVSLYLLYLST